MRFPKDFLNNYTKPNFYLCQTDKTKICKLDTTATKGSFKFNQYSELSFEVARTYNDMLTGEMRVNPYFELIESPRLVYVEGFGYFEIQGPNLHSDGIKEHKTVTAYSAEYTLSTKYLDDLYVNTGGVDSVEVIYAENNDTTLVPVTLYNAGNTELSLLHIILEKIYGWKIGHVDTSLKTLSRSFEVDRMSVYDFIINEICAKFNCFVVFDTIDNTINLYAESLTAKFVGDGSTNKFTISPPFVEINTISIDGYKTTRWQYDAATGVLTLDDVPENGSHIEVVDGSMTEWETDVFITFDNLAQEIDVSYSSDDIKTVLTITYGDNGDIREANLGLPYITDLSYFYTPEWMGKDLYDAYTAYIQKINNYQTQYTNNSQALLDLANYIDFEENRLSLEYSMAQSVNSETVGTYYTRGGSAPNYYYTEVSLPAEYDATVDYYSMDTANLAEEKVGNLYTVLKNYFYNYFKKERLGKDGDDNEIKQAEEGMQKAIEEFDALIEDFKFMEKYTLSYLKDAIKNGATIDDKEAATNNFLGEMWEQIGRTPLKMLYYEPYKQTQIANMEAGWSQQNDTNYGQYYPVVLMLNSIDAAIAKRDTSIKNYEEQYITLQKANADISDELLMDNNFTEAQMVRLSAFLREDELQLDDIVETEFDTIADSFKLKQDAIESGRIELQKLCQPQFQFSMTMANIYALPEFEPIIYQFQLGRVVKVGLRSDYIRQSRLMQADINFDDFSDFSCSFGDLTTLRTQSDIHADLLSQAITAGKSVAQNASYWTRGSEQASKTDLKIQQGLLDAVEAIKSTEGTQSSYLDKYGLHLEKIDPDTGEKDPEQVWLVNNKIVFTDDNFKTSRMALGRVTVDGQEYYGVISEIMLAGYIEGTKMVGGTINIGEGAFVVHEDGTVTMSGDGHHIDGYATSEQMAEVKNTVESINDAKMYRVEIVTEDPTIISTSSDTATMHCRVYSWDVDITDNIDSSLFSWKRVSANEEQDNIWNAMPEHQGIKSITIDSDDIVENSSFTCEVELPE